MNLKKTALTIIMLMTIALAITVLPPAQAENWQTVTTITGATDQTTNYFTVPSGEWRVTWSITPTDPTSDFGVFYAFVYPKGEDALYVESIDGDSTNKNGVTYIHEGNREYYMKIGAANLASYTLTVEAEQATATPTPTSPSPTPTVPEYSDTATTTLAETNNDNLLIALLAIVIICIIVVAVRLDMRKNKKRQQLMQVPPPPP